MFKARGLIHLNFSYKVMFMLRKNFIPTPRIPNRHLFSLQKKISLNFYSFLNSNKRVSCSFKFVGPENASIEAAQEY